MHQTAFVDTSVLKSTHLLQAHCIMSFNYILFPVLLSHVQYRVFKKAPAAF